MKIGILLGSFLLLAVAALAQKESDPALEGSWTVLSVRSEGQPFAQLKGAVLELKGGRKEFRLPGGKVERGTYRVHPKKAPSHLDTTTAGTAEAGKGIYRIDAKSDELWICLCPTGAFRPGEFKAEAGSGTLLLKFKRAARAKPADPAAAPRAPERPPREPKALIAKTRPFRMGFTGFVYDTTLPAVEASRKFVRENGDLICHHIEGVPWAECGKGGKIPPAVLKDWADKKEATPKGGKVYLAISPGRGDLKVMDKCGPLPKELQGKSYAHPAVKAIYLNYCLQSIEFFQPDYLAIGIEVNEIHSAGALKWEAYVKLYEDTYRALKGRFPKLPIFASFTLHNLYKKQGPMLKGLKELMVINDLVAVSYYPFFVADSERLTALDWVVELFEGMNKPFAMVETNDAAERLKFPKAGYVIDGTPAKQLAYYEKLLELSQEKNFAFVVSFVHQDYDALWEKIKASSPELFMAWRDCGLLDERGKARPAYGLWRNYFELPLRK